MSLTLVISRLLPEPHAGLLAGLLFGTKTSLSQDFYEALVASGTLHIVALSGMNISIMSRLIQSCLMWRLGRRLSGITTLGAIAWFVWFVGMSPSVVRASLMGGVAILAVLFGRQYWAVCVWGITAGVMLLVYPLWIADVSFQLSTLATLGIILFGDTKTAALSGDKKSNILAVIKKMVGEDRFVGFFVASVGLYVERNRLGISRIHCQNGLFYGFGSLCQYRRMTISNHTCLRL